MIGRSFLPMATAQATPGSRSSPRAEGMAGVVAGGVAWAVALTAVAPALSSPAVAQQDGAREETPQEAGPTAERCAGPEFRQFDFWLGRWEVRDTDGEIVGHNEIRRVAGGCGLLERWEGAGSGTGVSINTYDEARGRWTQRWVGAGATLWLEGGVEEGPDTVRMVLTGTRPRSTPRGEVTDRITWTPLPNGRVRQVWEVRPAGGGAWEEIFHGLYRPSGSGGPDGAGPEALGGPNGGGASRDGDAIDTLALEAHARFLADDLLEGRGPASRGERLAGLYLTAQLRRLGLAPLPGHEYRLPVPLTAVHMDPAGARVRLDGGGDAPRTLRPPAFYHPGGSRASFRDFAGDLVFAGAASGALDALADRDVTGEVVALSPPWNGVADVEAELRRRGAAGVVELLPDAGRYERLRIVRGPTRYFLPDGVDDPPNQSPVPRIVGGPDLISALGLGGEAEPGNVLSRARALGRSLALELPHTTEERVGYNVAGYVPGADPERRDEWIVYVAHYDHVGFGQPTAGDSIWNGFIDNAAGSSMLLEIARNVAAAPPPRSVAFLWVTAEEQGLLGSNWFVHDPPLPLDRVRAAINLDGGAPPAPPADWGLTGAEESSAGEAARRVVEERVGPVRAVENGPQSDHWPFHRVGVPAVLLFPGSDLEGLSEDEASELRERWHHPHTPDDEWGPGFPLTGLERYATLALEIGRTLAGH